MKKSSDIESVTPGLSMMSEIGARIAKEAGKQLRYSKTPISVHPWDEKYGVHPFRGLDAAMQRHDQARRQHVDWQNSPIRDGDNFQNAHDPFKILRASTQPKRELAPHRSYMRDDGKCSACEIKSNGKHPLIQKYAEQLRERGELDEHRSFGFSSSLYRRSNV